MTRTAVTLDRVASFVIGALLLAAAALAILWSLDRLSGAPRELSAGPVLDASGQGWWPIALLAGGVLLVLVGLRWLATHRPARRISDFTLSTPGGDQHFTADLGSLADATAVAVQAHPAVRSAKAVAIEDRGRPTVVVRATVDSTSRLDDVVTAVDEAASTAATMLGDGDVAILTRVKVPRNDRRGVR